MHGFRPLHTLCVSCLCYITDCFVLCELYTWKILYRKRGTLGLENTTLRFQKNNEQMVRVVDVY